MSERSDVDRSKNAAILPPDFGTLTVGRNPVRSAMLPYATQNAAVVGWNTGGSLVFPEATGGTVTAFRYTLLNESLYNTDGSIGRLTIPSLGVDTRVFEGETSASMAKGAGHFASTSVWDGNVALAGVRPDRA